MPGMNSALPIHTKNISFHKRPRSFHHTQKMQRQTTQPLLSMAIPLRLFFAKWQNILLFTTRALLQKRGVIFVNGMPLISTAHHHSTNHLLQKKNQAIRSHSAMLTAGHHALFYTHATSTHCLQKKTTVITRRLCALAQSA